MHAKKQKPKFGGGVQAAGSAMAQAVSQASGPAGTLAGALTVALQQFMTGQVSLKMAVKVEADKEDIAVTLSVVREGGAP